MVFSINVLNASIVHSTDKKDYVLAIESKLKKGKTLSNHIFIRRDKVLYVNYGIAQRCELNIEEANFVVLSKSNKAEGEIGYGDVALIFYKDKPEVPHVICYKARFSDKANNCERITGISFKAHGLFEILPFYKNGFTLPAKFEYATDGAGCLFFNFLAPIQEENADVPSDYSFK